jgi:OOP family OmpA-OmpF porin
MKTAKFMVVLSLLACWLMPGISRAEMKAGVFTLSPMLGGVIMEGDQPVDDDGLAYSLALGYNLTKAIALEAVLAGANLDEEGSGDDVDLWTYRLDALYHFMPDNRLVPYLAAGIGDYSLDSDDEFMANYGAGLLYFLSENVALRADVRHLVAFNESNLEHNLLYTAGFKFQFAGTTEPVKPAPLDSDGDGVTDDLDQCPGTPQGAPVDDKGCPLDSDGDGVFDCLDQCPNTPKGMSVDAKGCELTLTLHINFDFDSAVIKPEFKKQLDKAAAFVRANSNVPYILIAGHTDSKGSEAYNQRLSERRAAAVRQALIDDYGLDGSKLVARGYGETQPKTHNKSEEGRYQNRRVELTCCAVLPE